jgi:hypothetical protein
VRDCGTVAVGHDIDRVMQESSVLYGCFNEEILGKDVAINMGPVQTYEGVLAET